jgi:hypothetical protein
MSRWTRISLAVVFAAGLIAAAAGCASDSLGDLDEGQSFSMGDLRWNVLYDRNLNPNQVEDGAYLTDAPAIGADQQYFAEFVLVQNEGDDPVTLPGRYGFSITDTTSATNPDATYYPLESNSLFSFPFGSTLDPDGDIPRPDSVAADGPTQGAMLLFLVSSDVTNNRPLELHICPDRTSPGRCQGEEATIKLDL